MSATTIRIDDPLRIELIHHKPKAISLSAFVRDMLEEGLRRGRMAEAARRYSEFLAKNPEEARAMEEWEDADLAHPVRPGRNAGRP